MRDDSVPCCEPEFWIYLIICFILVSLAGITSGLALGLLSFSQVDLEVLIKAGKPQDRKNAVKILPIVKNEHLLLCTLLIVKSLAIEALPIFLDSILPIWATIFLSVTFVLTFTEIIPQAVCSRHGLSLGANLSPLVRFFLLFLYPIACPVSKLLDCMLGKGHYALLRRAELKTLVDLHSNEAGKGGDLSHHETTIISGALDMAQKTTKDVMTPISETFCLDINSKLDMNTMRLITSKGHSRIPIYSGSPYSVIGIILVKDLIFCRPEDETPIQHLNIRSILRIHEDLPLYNILNQFQNGHSHMAIVVKSKKDMKITVNNEVRNHTILNLYTNSNSRSQGISSPHDQKASISISTNTSTLNSSDTEFQSPAFRSAIEQEKDLHSQGKNWEQEIADIAYENLEFLPDVDEEVIGIITMEDVMEELLQGEILDETDEYIAVHNKIRVNLQFSRTSSDSSGRVSVSRNLHRMTPEPSPLSSYTPILRSPVPPYIQPPLVKPTLYPSPGNSELP